jgi:hypothetical protein
MKSAIIFLLAIVAIAVFYLPFKASQQQDSVDELQVNVIQSKVASGLGLSGGPKAAVAAYYNANDEFPRSFSDAGVSINTSTLPDYIKGINLGSRGEIVISYEPGLLGLPVEVREAKLIFKPDPTGSGTLSWNCRASMPFGKYSIIIPAVCRA